MSVDVFQCECRACATSRSPLSRTPLKDETTSNTEEDIKAFVEAVVTSRPTSVHRLNNIREATRNEADLQMFISFIRSGWPKGMAPIPILHNEGIPIGG